MNVQITRATRRPLTSWRALPLDIRADFDYVEPEQADDLRFASYKGCWYDVQDIAPIATTEGASWAMVVSADHPFAKWDGMVNETYFGGVLFRNNTGASVQIAHYTV